MSKKGENIYKRKDGRWEGRYIKCHDQNGKAYYGYVYAHSYKEVKEKLSKEKYHAPIIALSETGKDIKYCDLLNLWFQNLRATCKESTFARYYHLTNKHIVPQLGNYLVKNISFQIVEQHISQLLINGRVDNKGGLSNRTVGDVLVLIKRSLKYAKSCGYIVNWDLESVSVKKECRSMRVLSLSEQQKLQNYLKENFSEINFGILLCLYTGIRIGELCALKWEDFDIENHLLHIKHTLLRIQCIDNASSMKTKIIITEPKSSNSIRTIPVSVSICNIAKEIRGLDNAFLLSNKVDKPIEPRTIQNHFKKCINNCHIPPANFHSLRHTFATRGIEIGFDPKSLSEILGHADVNITLNKYVHSSMKLKIINMSKMEELIN